MDEDPVWSSGPRGRHDDDGRMRLGVRGWDVSSLFVGSAGILEQFMGVWCGVDLLICAVVLRFHGKFKMPEFFRRTNLARNRVYSGIMYILSVYIFAVGFELLR